MLGAFLQAVRQAHPLIHCITNYVTVNDCANLLLAAGASPIMADAPEEAAEITARSQGLTLNLGTLQAGRIPAMLASGRQANRNGIPAVLDPVGAGASAFRTRTARQLLEEVRFAVIRATCLRSRPWPPAPAIPAGWTPGTGSPPRPWMPLWSCPAAGPPHRRGGGRHRRDRPCHRWPDRLLHPQRPPHDAPCHRRRVPALLPDGGFCRRQPWPDPAGRRGRRLRMGPVRRDRLRPAGSQEGNAAYRDKILDAVYRLTPAQLEEGARYELR